MTKKTMTARILGVKHTIDSLREELEAVDRYNQEADVCPDETLKSTCYTTLLLNTPAGQRR